MEPLEYEGRVYIRPLGRGVCLGEDIERTFEEILETWVRQSGDHVSPGSGWDGRLRIRVEHIPEAADGT